MHTHRHTPAGKLACRDPYSSRHVFHMYFICISGICGCNLRMYLIYNWRKATLNASLLIWLVESSNWSRALIGRELWLVERVSGEPIKIQNVMHDSQSEGLKLSQKGRDWFAWSTTQPVPIRAGFADPMETERCLFFLERDIDCTKTSERSDSHPCRRGRRAESWCVFWCVFGSVGSCRKDENIHRYIDT